MILEKALEEVEAKRKYVEAMRIEADIVEVAAEHFAPQFDMVSASIGWGKNQLQGALILFNYLNRLADIAPVLKYFAEKGYILDKTSDYEELQRRTWELRHREDKTRTIRVSGFFHSDGDGDSCRFVSVGKKEEDVYKFLCPDTEEVK